MGRPLRFIPENSIVEVTTRSMQGRFLLRPSDALNEVVLGVLGRGLERTPEIELFGFVFLSNHYHLLLRTPDGPTLSAFMGFINSNIAREVGRLHSWSERFWGRRFRSIPVLGEETVVDRLQYILGQGTKEGLVESPLDWPGASCVRALLEGVRLVGTWFDRTAEYRARRRRESFGKYEYAREYPVPLAPLPCWSRLSVTERRAEARRLLERVMARAKAEASARERPPLGPEAVMRQSPHQGPRRHQRSPAPLVHASCPQLRRQFREQYRRFVAGVRAAAAGIVVELGLAVAGGQPP